MSYTDDVFRAAGMNYNSSQMLSFWELAIFNAERARGVMHTPEYCEKMKVMQKQYNDWLGDRPNTENWA
jgi:hypothetical protein